MMTSADIRQKFLDFFRSKGHEIVPSAPIVVKNDPTLMFTNAGMNQFKDYFLGNKKASYPRVADTQKCLRVSGKHNDLEEVGVDTYHHTMFEMLGNWSFGDYFKKEAIEWSWELLTKVYGLDKNMLYVTIFEGDKKEGLPKDDEALTEWKKWIAEDRILFGNKKDNFWEMGDTGPCGPCTEIHVDCRTNEERKKVDGKTLVNKDHPQVIEIWNNVFIQFNRLKDGSLELLPARHVDTGMGLERLVRVLQNKTSNYDTDIFSDTIAETEKVVGKKYNANAANSSSAGESWREAVAFRVIADHIRAISFTIADAQLPSNTGAGYVIRRILRRAVRYYYSYLDYKKPLLHQLVIGLSAQFKYVFPELYQQAEFVTKVIREEEEAFLRTLEKGLKRIDDIIQSSSSEIISGKDAFDLYDTYGFPIDLTRLIASENNLSVDEKSFITEMQQQKDRSRAATAIDTEDWIVLNDKARNEFIGYDSLWSETKIVKYRKAKAKGKESYQTVLEVTPFYAESGGQVGDTGELILPSPDGEGPGVRLVVTDTKKDNDLIIHFTDKLPTEINGTVIAIVDAGKRKNIALHHSATHLLHAALRKVLGNHVAQKGSLVNAEHLRFDFSHFAKMTDEEIAKVESLVNQKIRENIPVVINYMSKEEALKLGAMALFGEKYGDVVRVVIIDPDYSVELCGGTHAGATGELGLFKLINESAVAAGVRRVEAITGKPAEDYINEQFTIIKEIHASLKNPKDINRAVADLIKDRSELQKVKEQLEKLQAHATLDSLILKKELINSVQFYHDIIINADSGVLKRIYLELEIKDAEAKSIALLIGKKEGKVNVLLGCSSSFKDFDCNKIIKEHIAPAINGGGGGQKFMAIATGSDSSNIDSLVRTIKDMLVKPL
jgi:alanyl-tRNA synthetase